MKKFNEKRSEYIRKENGQKHFLLLREIHLVFEKFFHSYSRKKTLWRKKKNCGSVKIKFVGLFSITCQNVIVKISNKVTEVSRYVIRDTTFDTVAAILKVTFGGNIFVDYVFDYIDALNLKAS